MKFRGISMAWLALAITFVLPVNSTTNAADQKLPNVVILATGGTIAGTAESETETGYRSGQVGVDVLLEAVPELQKIAKVTGEQVANVGSQNMSDEIWLKLADRINELLKSNETDGIVITHGTDTMEETAYFLNLVVRSKKPVVMTGAMRPSTAMSADGPLNIYNAVGIAAGPNAAGRGVMVVTNDDIHGARAVMKSNTTDVQTFISPTFGLIGTVTYGEAQFYRKPFARHTHSSQFSVEGVMRLPRVDIIAMYEDVPGDIIDAAVELGAEGIVLAGVGNGNMTDSALEASKRARAKGVVVVRASRVPTGYVDRNIELDDDDLGFVASYDLSPQKARILLRLALLKTNDWKEIQELFANY
ncbi:MAG: type II asparaginase [Candidatus Krumholzibacteria bacterium]|nr:type II asparaginase [Candidatus Krumholzibacteria bacterium]